GAGHARRRRPPPSQDHRHCLLLRVQRPVLFQSLLPPPVRRLADAVARRQNRLKQRICRTAPGRHMRKACPLRAPAEEADCGSLQWRPLPPVEGRCSGLSMPRGRRALSERLHFPLKRPLFLPARGCGKVAAVRLANCRIYSKIIKEVGSLGAPKKTRGCSLEATEDVCSDPHESGGLSVERWRTCPRA